MEILTDNDIPTIRKECSGYIKYIKKYKFNLYRGSNNEFPIKKKSHLKNRIPTVGVNGLHEYLNEASKNVFGWKVRNGVMVSNNYHFVKNFGNPSYFLPCNGYEFVYSKDINDLNLTGKSILFSFIKDNFLNIYEILDNNELKSNKREIIRICEIFYKEYYTNKNLKDVGNKTVEISFNAQYYYLINESNMMLNILDIKNFDGWKV